MSLIGLDIGTFYAKVAVIHGKCISMVPNEQTKLRTPTLVTLTRKERINGEAAATGWTRNVQNTFSQTKRLMGRQLDDPHLEDELGKWCFQDPNSHLTKVHNERVGALVATSQNDQVLLPEQILGGFMGHLKQMTSSFLEGAPVRDCVLTCPLYFDDSQRRALLTAARLADLNVLRLMNETTATALCYGMTREIPSNSPDTVGRTVLFVDVGVANTQMSVVEFRRGSLKVVGSASDPFVGARNFDLLLFNHFCKEFEDRHGISLEDRSKAKLRLYRAVNRMKKILSANKDCSSIVECFVDEIDLPLDITRMELEEMAAPLLEEIGRVVKQVLRSRNGDASSIDAVEIVGRGSRIPCVQERILSEMKECGWGGESLSTTLNGDESVARGAAWMCALLSPKAHVRDLEVKDMCPCPIAVEYMKNGAMRTDLVAPAGQSIPWTAKIRFANGSFEPGQVFGFQIRQIDEMDSDGTERKKKMQTNPVIGEFEVDVPPLVNPNPTVGEPKLKCVVKQDVNGLISDVPEVSIVEWVESESSSSGKEKIVRSLDVRASFVNEPREELVMEMKNLEEALQRDDALVVATTESRNDLESYIYRMRDRVVDELNSFVTEAERREFQRELEETENWLYEDGSDVSKEEYDGVMARLQWTGDRFEKRLFEQKHRQEAIKTFGKCVRRLKKLMKNLKEEEHVETERMEGKITECVEWLKRKTEEQRGLKVFEDPVLCVSDIEERVEEMKRVWGSIGH